MTIKEYARREGVSEKTVYSRIKSGELKAVKVGQSWDITNDTEAIQDAMDFRKVKTEYEAKLAELAFLKASGELVEADKIYALYIPVLQQIGQRLDNIHYVIFSRLMTEKPSDHLAAVKDELDKFRSEVQHGLLGVRMNKQTK